MIVLIIVVVWVVLLTPFAVRRFREANGDKPMLNFREGVQILRRQGYSVQPARILEDEVPLEVGHNRPHLRVVRDEDLVGVEKVNPYAAYATVPNALIDMEAPLRPLTSMRVRRSRMFVGLTLSTVLLTAVAALSGGSLFVDGAFVAGSALIGFVALALVAVALGYLEPSSLGIRSTATAYPAMVDDQPMDVDFDVEPRQYAVG